MKKITLILATIAATLPAVAQLDLTLYNARYLQQSSFTNAAFTPECKVNIGGIVFGSTYLYYGNSGITRASVNDFAQGLSGASKALDRMKPLNYLEFEARKDIIHFGFRVKRNYFSLNTSIRSQTSIIYPRDLATLIFVGNGAAVGDPNTGELDEDYLLLGKRADFDGSGIFHKTYAEIGLQYARTFFPGDELSVGIRPKLLLGLANVNTNSFTMGLHTNADNFAMTLDGSYDISTSLPFDTAGEFDYSPFKNLGFGLDLGASYNITEKLQVSASANDIGFITWKINPNTYSTPGGTARYAGIDIAGSIFDAINNFDSLGGDFQEQLLDSANNQFGADTNTDSYRTWLTARYNLGLNYNFTERQNVSLLLNAHRVQQKLRAAFTIGYNFRVRKWFGFHLNYSIYNRSFLNVGAGLSFNLFPWQFYLMTDNALSFLPNSRNFMVRGGINWTFGCKDFRDKDKDGIEDKVDLCPTEYGPEKTQGCPDRDLDGIADKDDVCPDDKGPAETQGCPDRDADGIVDKDDDCPDAPGIADFKGCPDTDEDGLKDSDDECPTVAGIAAFNGCPDTDADGIRDSEDACPEVAGLQQFNGCPDTDGDGIQDKEDACPEKAGTAQYQGCPDTDSDGLPDQKDGCPEIAGPVDNNGCPYGDRDGDGIADKDDNCPDISGPAENKGCPYSDLDNDGVLDKDDACLDTPGPAENKGCPYSDLDGDGVLDKDDRCPQTAGPADNEGCPVIEKEEQEVLNTAFANLEFETGKDIIKQSSYESLDKLAELMIKKSEWRIQISGHTDNVGNDAANMTLSEKRSKAVAAYLESRGVQRDRMVVQWFGETKPVADNATPEGRTKNRRVEMEIIFE